MSRRLGMGLVGPGFVGAHHIDAVRRLGFVDVVAVAASTSASAEAKARTLGVTRPTATYEALAADPDVDVVHVTTPNALHGPVIDAALAHGKHVVCDKPLATTAAEARRLRDAAAAAGVVHAVTFNYRGNPLVQQARAMVAAGEVGPVHLVHGAYLQDWLLEDTDYSWRLDPAQGESSAMADIGSHWCDLAQHVSGQRIAAVLASLTTVVASRIKPGQATPGLHGRRRHRHPRADRQRGPGHGAAALLRRRHRRGHRRPGVRGPQERLLARDLRPPGLAALGAGTPERAVDRRPAPRQHRCWRRTPRWRTPKRSPTCGCPRATRKAGPTRSST